MARSPLVALRLTDADRARWEAAAADAGMSLSAWIRETVDAALDEPVANALIGMQADDNRKAARRKVAEATKGCSRARFHRPGVHCKECGS